MWRRQKCWLDFPIGRTQLNWEKTFSTPIYSYWESRGTIHTTIRPLHTTFHHSHYQAKVKQDTYKDKYMNTLFQLHIKLTSFLPNFFHPNSNHTFSIHATHTNFTLILLHSQGQWAGRKKVNTWVHLKDSSSSIIIHTIISFLAFLPGESIYFNRVKKQDWEGHTFTLYVTWKRTLT